MTRARLATVVKTVAALAVLAAMLGALGWWSTGGRWFDVRTASMGHVAPVGALLLVKPVAMADVHVGDLVSFRQPDSGKIYTHRVVERSGQTFHTKGDVNKVTDPWTIDQAHLIGRVSHVWPAVGYALRGLPLFLIAFGVIWLVSTVVPAAWRQPARVAGVGLAFGIVCLLLQPWVGLDRVGVTRQDQGAKLEAVSTGVLPVRAKVKHEEPSARIRSGEVTTVDVPSDGTRYSVSAVPSLTGWWWALVGLICLGPLLWSLAMGVAPHEEARHA